MRCLYCGKELALLKRWTGGGEFCSDAHRQRYQEEYNQLALNRLLQAKPAEPQPHPDTRHTAKPAESKAKEPAAEPALESSRTLPPSAVLEPTPEPAPEPVPEPVPQMIEEPEEDPAPAEAGFFIEMPVPAAAATASSLVTETDFERRPSPSLPAMVSEPWQTSLLCAGQVILQPSLRVADYTRAGDGRLELREFLRTPPLVEFDLRPTTEGIAEISEEPMDIVFLPQPPQASPPLWSEAETEFAFPTELGSLARMVFGTTGMEDNNGHGGSVGGEEPLPVEAPHAETVRHDDAPSVTISEKFAEPVFNTPKPAAPAVANLSPAAAFLAMPAGKPAMRATSAENKSQSIPEIATRPLPVTLHALAAVRGKPVQVFPTALTGGVDLQVPRSSGLPLRPTMILESAKPESKKQTAPNSRPVNGKTRRPEPEKTEPEKKIVPAAVKEPAPEKTAPEKPVILKEPEPPPAEPPKLFAAPDLGLPSLNLNQSEGFWGRLPVAGKAAFVLAIVLAIGGAVYALTRGANPAPASNSPQVVEAGPALTALDSGWITDWGAEPGVRREHQISVLRPSLNLSDYRVEFEAQIDTKALGWIYRAVDDRNYYVNKLEIVKPGLTPTVALVRFAVINGEEQPRAQFPLNMSLHLDTLYQIRFDAVGDRFTTYVQGQKIDEWTDDRLKMGGIGLYNERGEHMSLKGTVNVVPLVIRR